MADPGWRHLDEVCELEWKVNPEWSRRSDTALVYLLGRLNGLGMADLVNDRSVQQAISDTLGKYMTPVEVA